MREEVGPPHEALRRQGHPYRRARHPACQETKAAQYFRQHLVGRWVSSRRDCSPPSSAGETHEKKLPPEGRRHKYGLRRAIYLMRPGADTRVRSWTPTPGPQYGFLVTHNEAISIADYFTRPQGRRALYRPTCHYAYHPSNDAVLSLHEMFGNSGKKLVTTTFR